MQALLKNSLANCNYPKKFPYCCLLIIASSILEQCSVFKVQTLTLKVRFERLNFLQALKSNLMDGGPKWTRTTDLTIISRVL